MGTPGFATASTIPWFGRAWKLEIITSNGTILTAGSQSFSTNDESLKVSFSTSVTATPTTSAAAFADVSIYNLNQNTQQAILNAVGRPWNANDPIQQANVVSIFAGYQNNFNAQSLPLTLTEQGMQPTGKTPASSSSLIWTGQVFMPLWERVNVTDFKITLHCLVGFAETTQSSISVNIGRRSTQVDTLRLIASAATNGIHIDDIADLETSQSATQPLPRGQTLFGRPADYLAKIAQTNYMSYYYASPNGINVRTFKPTVPDGPPQFVYGPPWPGYLRVQPKYPLQYTPTLIGTPQQTQDGVVFRVLMDARPKLGNTVMIDLTAITLIALNPSESQNQPTPLLNSNATYVICNIRHVGDTRGDDWYTEITAVNATLGALYGQVGPLPNTSQGN